MKCSVVLDLLPLYEEGVCSDETKEYVVNHLEECNQCREIYNDMKVSIDTKYLKKENEVISSLSNEDKEFWYKYYKRLFGKGIALYLAIYFSLVLLGLLISKIYN